MPILRYLTLHLKSLDKFVSFSVTVLDEKAQTRLFKVSNHRSHCVISTEVVEGEEVSVCELPMTMGTGWQVRERRERGETRGVRGAGDGRS